MFYYILEFSSCYELDVKLPIYNRERVLTIGIIFNPNLDEYEF